MKNKHAAAILCLMLTFGIFAFIATANAQTGTSTGTSTATTTATSTATSTATTTATSTATTTGGTGTTTGTTTSTTTNTGTGTTTGGTSTTTGSGTGTTTGTSTTTGTTTGSTGTTTTGSNTNTGTGTTTSTTTSTSTNGGGSSITLRMIWDEIMNLKAQIAYLQMQLQILMARVGLNSDGSSATSTPTSNEPGLSGPVTVTPNNWTVRAGTTVDFTGRNFGREEDVRVEHQGNPIRVAHADGGGNFSTGSITVSRDLGSHTYSFTGVRSGISRSVTITVTP